MAIPLHLNTGKPNPKAEKHIHADLDRDDVHLIVNFSIYFFYYLLNNKNNLLTNEFTGPGRSRPGFRVFMVVNNSEYVTKSIIRLVIIG